MSRAAQKSSDEPKQLSPLMPAPIMNFSSLEEDKNELKQ